MASKANATAKRAKPRSIAPDRLEQAIGALALALFAAALAAVLRGRAEWSELPWQVWAHLGTIAVALAITPAMMWRRRGDRWHRRLGWAWCAAMTATAIIAFGIRFNTPGKLSWIHSFSVLTLACVPVILVAARTHRIDLHRNTVRGLVIGALLLAGFFTFPFDRLLGRWLFG